jgi:hypothetical protein
MELSPAHSGVLEHSLMVVSAEMVRVASMFRDVSEALVLQFRLPEQARFMAQAVAAAHITRLQV